MKALCEICGEPMQPGEEMFKVHGYFGDCPKPPLPKPTIAAVVEYVHRHDDEGFWIGIRVDRVDYQQIGPFTTEGERQQCHDDMLNMMRQVGARDLPAHPQ